MVAKQFKTAQGLRCEIIVASGSGGIALAFHVKSTRIDAWFVLVFLQFFFFFSFLLNPPCVFYPQLQHAHYHGG